MFTGIVTAIGTVRTVNKTPKGLAITIAAPYRGLATGESIAVDGACLTIVRRSRGAFTVQAVTTTRGRTNFGSFRAGRRVNLERALKVGERLGGHLVSGHVDGVGEVVRRTTVDDAVLLDIRVPAAVAALCVPHGSVSVEGVSLTVNALPRVGVVQVSLIPYTLRETTLGRAKAGTRVHLEADLVGKFVMQALAPYPAVSRRRSR